MGEDDDREIFEKALQTMAPGDVFRGKYGQPEDPSESKESAPEDEGSREEIQRLRELREMERAFAGVDKIDQGKLRAAPLRDDLSGAQADQLRAEFEAAMAPAQTAPEAVAEAPPRQSLAEQAGDSVHTINLRGMDPGTAIGKLGLFVDIASKDRRDFIRIRVGSNAELLEAVKNWFRGAGTAYVDEFEVAQAHTDAAIFARIRCTVIP